MNTIFLMQDTAAVYGAERATLDLASGLARRGVNAHVLLIHEERLQLADNRLQTELTKRGLPFSLVHTDRAFSWKLARDIRRRLVELEADVLQTVGYKADLHAWLAAGRRVVLVAAVHGWLFRPDLKERFYGWLDVRVLRRFARVIVLSRHYADLVVRQGVAAHRVVRIPSGLDLKHLVSAEVAESLYRTPRLFTVGMLGRLSWEKNHGMFLEAMRLLRERGVEVRGLIAGEGPERARIEQAVNAMGLGDAVKLEGYMDSSRFFEQVHALALCSRVENLPYSVLEAMSWCRPVLATRVGGLPDLVEDARTGFLVPPDDAAALADALTSLANQPARALELGRAGRQRLETHFSLDRTVESHIDLYTSLASTKNVPD